MPFAIDDRVYFQNVQSKFPPLLEKFAMRQDSASVGLNKDGRTVTWMKGVQTVVMGVVSCVSAIAGMILGAIAGTAKALVERNSEVLGKTTYLGMDIGFRIGAHAGAAIGSALTSVTTPFASGGVNLLEMLIRKGQLASNPNPDRNTLNIHEERNDKLNAKSSDPLNLQPLRDPRFNASDAYPSEASDSASDNDLP